MLDKWNEPELNKQIFATLIKLGNEMICSTLQNADASAEDRNTAVDCSQLVYKASLTM
jgi:hypothetical protein